MNHFDEFQEGRWFPLVNSLHPEFARRLLDDGAPMKGEVLPEQRRHEVYPYVSWHPNNTIILRTPERIVLLGWMITSPRRFQRLLWAEMPLDRDECIIEMCRCECACEYDTDGDYVELECDHCSNQCSCAVCEDDPGASYICREHENNHNWISFTNI